MAQDEDDKLEEELKKRWDPAKLSQFLKLREGKAQRLDFTTRQKYERKFGVGLGDVRIFTGGLAEEITAAHDAEALTVADTGMVLLGNSSKYTPGSTAGEALLAHELTHVAQSKPSTVQRKAVSDAPLATEESEREAEAVEAETYSEASGGHGHKEDASDKAKGGRELREKLTKRVLEMFEAEYWTASMRCGK